MNCGADSRKASRSPELRVSCLILATRSEFWGRLVSIIDRANKERRFLEKKVSFDRMLELNNGTSQVSSQKWLSQIIMR